MLICLLLYLFICQFFQSCADDETGPSTLIQDSEMQIDVTLTTKAPGVESAVAVNSVRMVIFDRKGKCLFNSVIPEDDLTRAVDGDVLNITVSPFVSVPGDSRELSIYAVLNEAGIFNSPADTDATLDEKLSEIAVGTYSHDSFVALMDTEFMWSESESGVTSEAPAFLMFLKAENVSVPDDCSSPFNVSLSAEGDAVPSMAIIEVDKITSEAVNGLAYDRLSDAARVFVLDVHLESIPSTYTATKSADGKEKKSISLLKRNSEGYCDREWPGKISQRTTGELTQVDRVDKRYYRYIVGAQGDGCWSMVTHAQAATYSNIEASDRYNGNNGNIRAFINDQLIPLFQHPSSYVSDPLEKGGLEDDEAEPDNTVWNIPVHKSFYVTENISDDPSVATSVVIKLAVATPDLDHSQITDGEWSSMAAWDDPEFMSDGYPIASYTTSSRDFFRKFSHACWADSQDVIDVAQSGKQYKFFVGNFSRVRTGTVNKLFKTGDRKIKTSWKKISTSEKIVEFRVPINNCRFDSDYSIKRGIRYKISLHVNGNTYDKICNPATKAEGCSDAAIITEVKASEI